jgi:L-threonylcarbamoyladenylate synthase
MTVDPVPAMALRAAEVLARGGLVGLPTETVYGLAADASNPRAVRRIFEVKGRPAWHPLILHLAEPEWLSSVTRELGAPAEALARAFWPGPLTLVVRRAEAVLPEVTAGLDTVAVRVPGHALARAVIAALGRPVAAPSANRFGRVSPTTAAHVREDLGDEVDLVLDGGPCSIGVESTILDLTTGWPRLLRPGGLPSQSIEAVLGAPLRREGPAARSAGQLAAHYAPRAPLHVFERQALAGRARRLAERGERAAAVAAGDLDESSGGALCFPLPVDLEGFARALYGALREADRTGATIILVEQVPGLGVGEAIADRLARAAGR